MTREILGAGYIELEEKTVFIYLKDGRNRPHIHRLFAGDTLSITDEEDNEYLLLFRIKRGGKEEKRRRGIFFLVNRLKLWYNGL